MELEWDSEIGRGAWAHLWRAKDKLGRYVAVKFIDGDEPSEIEHSALQHARALVRVDHPSVVKVYAVEEQPHPESGRLQMAIVMEYFESKGLHLHGETIPASVALTALENLAEGLSAIHKAGLVHGDLHEGNILLGEESAKIIDILYTHSLAGVGGSTAQRTILDDVRDFAKVSRKVVEKVPGVEKRLLEEAYFQASSARSPPSVVDQFRLVLVRNTTDSRSPLEGVAIADVGKSFEEIRKRTHVATWQSLRDFREACSQQSTVSMLKHLIMLRAVDPDGVGARVAKYSAKAFFSLDYESIKVDIETPSGRGTSLHWKSNTSAAQFLVSVADACRSCGAFSAAGEVSASLFESLLSSCILGAACRTDKVPGDFKTPEFYSPEFHPVILVVNPHWALTTYGLESTVTSYPVEVSRLFGTEDWANHLRRKHWVDEDLMDEALYEAQQVFEPLVPL